ncbi:MAG TPA: hypothetical protein VE546_17065, partial [Streptomyces sp.]|uniref:trypsin-like serine peptidase n=1 Tax=Streptomyces sp. TaxID=1931 RepID=UPI002D3B3F4E|nr:hypothetical protein [Streptomyces sp.]
MSSVSRGRSALTAAAVVAALAVTATACGPSDEEADANARPSASAQDGSNTDDGTGGLRLPKELPDALKDFDPEKWRNGEWKNWDRDRWVREAKDFVNPIIEGLWDPDRMKDARENDRRVDDSDIDGGDGGDGGASDEGVTDPEPRPKEAQPVAAPYRENAPAVGKVFMDTPKGSMVCSGTVVKDPRNPGKSNLVATAGHCVHAGKDGGWFRNI